MYSYKARVRKKTKPPFLVGLEKWQNRYVNYWESQGVNARKDCFYIEHDDIAVLATESEYRQLQNDEKVLEYLAYLGMMLGVELSLSKREYALHIHFHYGSGFLCYRKFYGKYKKTVHEKLKKELSHLMKLDVGGEIKKTKNTRNQISKRKKWEQEIKEILQENE